MDPEIMKEKVVSRMSSFGAPADAPACASNESDRQRQHWHVNLLKQRLVHRSGLLLQGAADGFQIGVLPRNYPAAKLLVLHDEARLLYRALAQRWTAAALQALADRLRAMEVASGRGELCLQRSLDAEGNLLDCRIAGVELPQVEVAEIFGDCTTLGVLQHSRTTVHGENGEPPRQTSEPGGRAPVPPMRRAQIAGFQAIEGLDAFAINFAALAQLASRGLSGGRPRPS
ncbi:hypothetical protein CTP10_R52860 [Cupriavidus sp. P-10]|uniref:hypothetical protein n=1 Tax=Cupriavidus sp. P-10 TaxID=2027911 RepID=UPI000E2F513A|nr:hypothetical protein [Cupriavidus sp. P-10]BDB27876.1 hypothetical protein CTP10_R52860 [Cupriavidus sp. P-10]